VFFALEGVLKNDALLTAGEAVFNVPSVTLWQNAWELEEFALEWLRSVTVYVVVDSDWEDLDDRNHGAVMMQGLLCRDFLRRILDNENIHLVAPPAEGDSKHGVDDFLGPYKDGRHRSSVAELLVIEREAPKGLEKWIRQQPGRIDGVRRDAKVLKWSALHANPRGRVEVPTGTIAKHVGMSTKSVNSALERLEQRGAIHGLNPRPKSRHKVAAKKGQELLAVLEQGQTVVMTQEWQPSPPRSFTVSRGLRAVTRKPLRTIAELEA
jgi:hypothetical protein